MIATRKPRRRLQYGGYEGLAAPTLPQARNGALDMNGVGDSVQVCVARYTDYRISDSFIVLLDGAPAPFVPPPDDAGGDITLLVPAWAFSNGSLAVCYGVADAAGNGALSPPTVVEVSGATSTWLPPPVFPDFSSGRATFQDVARAGGVLVRAPCADLRDGDSIIVTWQGYTGAWAPVPDAMRVLLSRPVTAADLAAGHIDAMAKMGDVLAAGDGGHCVARYVIHRPGVRGPGAVQASIPEKPACAFASGQALATDHLVAGNPDGGSQPRGDGVWESGAGISRAALLQLTVGEPFILASATSGAPFRTPDRPWLAPANRVWILAPPFHAVTLSVDAGIRFAASDSDTLSVVTDAAGLAVADICQQGPSPTWVDCNVTAVDVDAGGGAASVVSRFPGRYLVDQTGAMSYGCRATAIAGGNDVCQISVVLPITMADVAVAASGSALVNGYEATGVIEVHLDQTCTISITNDVAEVSTITLGDGVNCHAQIDVAFILTPFCE